MYGKLSWLTLVGILALAFVSGGVAQPPGKKGPPDKFGKKGKGPAREITSEQIIERLMAFDKNNDGKITMDELPERMQHLMALGDANKDGVLDKDEVRKLAETVEMFVGLAAPAGPGQGPGGPKGFGGPKGKGKGRDPEVQRSLDDLKLDRKTRDQADGLVRGYDDKLKRFHDQARTELIAAMKDVLSEDDYKYFKTDLERPTPPFDFGGKKKFDDKKGKKKFDQDK